MATISPAKSSLSQNANAASVGLDALLWKALQIAGSLKITCVMFALGVFILFVGTLAQDESTIVDVKKEYFNSWVAVVPFDVFVPQTLWPHADPVPYAFAIPGGALVGWVLLINLVAAKVTRFPLIARGNRFLAGLALTAVGFVLIGLIVVGAHFGDGLQGEPPFSYDAIWYGCLAALWLLVLGLGGCGIFAAPKHTILIATLWTFFSIFAAVGVFLLATGDAYRIPDPGLRIVWQLAKSGLVSGVLLVGLILLFGARGGNVLIHLGIALLMVGQFVFGDQQREERIALFEGQRTSAAVQTDIVELAVIDTTMPDKNRVVAFDHPLLERALANKTLLSDKSLPFEIRIERYMVNSDIKPRRSDPKLQQEAAEWIGLPPEIALVEAPKSGGAKSEMNYASAYVSIREKKSSKELGKFALSQYLNDPMVRPVPIVNTLDSDGRTFELALRFRRNLKPFSFELKDVVLEQYTGTAIPKDYSSYVRIVDQDGATLQEGRIWMNSPMRFRGETYYQSSYQSADQSAMGVEQTVLQVVTNAGWLIPYVSCVLVGLGMFSHFGITLTRFASRYDRNAFVKPARKPIVWVSLALPVLVAGGLIAVWAKPPSTQTDRIDWYRIGTLPVQHEGRMKPLAGAGAQLLKTMSNKPYALTSTGHSYEGGQKTGEAVSSAQWMMSVMAHDRWVLDAPLVRIDAKSLLDELGLKRHKSNCYSIKQVTEKLDGMEEKTRKILEKKERGEKWSFEEQKFMDLQSKLIVFFSVWNAYEPIDEILSRADSPEKLSQAIAALEPLVESLESKNPPAAIPPREVPASLDPSLPPPKWHAYVAAFYDVIRHFDPKNVDNPTSQFRDLIRLVRDGNMKAKEINAAVIAYETMLNDRYGALARLPKTRFEAWYEYFNPIGLSYMLYIIAGLTCLMSFTVAREPLRQAAFWLCVLTLVLHTIAIMSRIYISERPPVVSLYSAAVFIGWAIVLACVIAEFLFPISISLLVASLSGYLSLQVAYGLDIGDSMPVLQAVLDTQFWLSTHVISVSLGYSATFLAGFLGIAIIAFQFAQAWVSKSAKAANAEIISTMYRICYGIVCFGIFFSFVGTVLGGLWGDDSWGRFWGWDPKENGALMIVLWNALLLHARWDKLVGPLGFAMLAVVGNIITAWSMFGTNILGIGLHAYGGDPGDSIRNMAVFVASQLAVIAVGGIAYAMTSDVERKPSAA